MKKILFGLLSFICMIGFVSCSESSPTETTTLTVDPLTLTFTTDGGTADLTINSNAKWSITASNEDIQVSPSSGSGNQVVKVTVPQRKLIEQIESKLVVKTSDGAVIRNVSIIQEGLLVSGGLLRFGNHNGAMTIDGKAQSVDSLVIISNAPWELRGPEWIEVYQDGKWIALSTARAMIMGNETVNESNVQGGETLYIRATQDNNSVDYKEDVLTLSQPYSGDLKCELIVIQLGKYGVFPNSLLYLATGMATDWKVGTGVKKFYWQVTKNTLTTEDMAPVFSSWPTVNIEDVNVSYWWGLEENTLYNVYTWVQDGDSYFWNSYYFTTGSTTNQAIADIKNVYQDGNIWRWEIWPNEYCKLFSLWASDDQNLFNEPDVYVAWIVEYVVKAQLIRLPEGEHGNYWWEKNAPIQIISWGTGQDGTKMADIISRYYTNDGPANARKCESDIPSVKANSKKIDIESIKKSFYKIK